MNYLISVAVALVLIGCSDGSNDSKSQAEHIQQSATKVETEVKKVEEKTTHVVEETKKEAQKAVQKVEKADVDVTHEKAVTQKEVQKATVPATKAPTPIQKQKEALEQKVAKKVAIDPQALYKVCAGCHGAKGEKKALNKSAVIAGWDPKKVADALEGYKDGSRNVYGMGSVMKAQTSKLTSEEMQALGEYISKF